MQARGIINLSQLKRILCKVRTNGKFILFVFTFALGFLVGVLGYEDISFAKNVFNFLTEYFCKARVNATFLNIAINSLLNFLLLLVITFSSGTTMMGLIFIPCSVLSSGFIFGVLGAGLYSTFSYRGVAFFAVLIIPWAVFLVIAIILSAIEAFDFSLLLTRVIGLKEKCEDISARFRLYCIKYALLCIFIAVAAVIDGFLSHNFFASFNLF